MAIFPYRANLNAAMFPLVSRYQGQTVIVRGQDGNFVPSVSPKADKDKDIGIPQTYYMHNVLPTPHGLSAVAYSVKKTAVAGVTFSRVLTVRDDAGNVATLGILSGSATMYITKPGQSTWTQVIFPEGISGATDFVSVAYVSGTTYIFIKGVGCFTLNFNTNTLTKVVMDGLDETTIIGVISSSGYLIAYSRNAVAWSSTLDPLDFVPDLATGAGGGGVEGVKGDIVVITPTSAGFIVYTAVNAVASSYSGNSRYPFNFREIVGAGGIEDSELAVSEGAAGLQYAYTSYGLQAISFQQAQILLPEITDFISGSYFEDFNEVTDEFEYTVIPDGSKMRKKLQLIAGRYLVLSYGVTSLTHALVYDLGLERLGKAKIPHVDVFDFAQAGNESLEAAKKSLAFLQADGTVQTASVEFGVQGSGVLIQGRYQINRTRMTQLEEVQLENFAVGSNYSIKALVDIDGEVIDKQDGYLAKDTGTRRVYNFSAVGESVSLLHKGGFKLTSMVLAMHIHGRM